MARGRYLINYEMFEEHIAGKCINDDEVGKIRSLFKKLEMINVCKQTLHSVLINLIHKQSAYIDSGNFNDLLPLSQKELALQLGINPAALSRATKCRTRPSLRKGGHSKKSVPESEEIPDGGLKGCSQKIILYQIG